MIFNRARQIFESSESIQVQYRGKPVWIDGLNQEGETARISTDTETLTVLVQELLEG